MGDLKALRAARELLEYGISFKDVDGGYPEDGYRRHRRLDRNSAMMFLRQIKMMPIAPKVRYELTLDAIKAFKVIPLHERTIKLNAELEAELEAEILTILDNDDLMSAYMNFTPTRTSRLTSDERQMLRFFAAVRADDLRFAGSNENKNKNKNTVCKHYDYLCTVLLGEGPPQPFGAMLAVLGSAIRRRLDRFITTRARMAHLEYLDAAIAARVQSDVATLLYLRNETTAPWVDLQPTLSPSSSPPPGISGGESQAPPSVILAVAVEPEPSPWMLLTLSAETDAAWDPGPELTFGGQTRVADMMMGAGNTADRTLDLLRDCPRVRQHSAITASELLQVLAILRPRLTDYERHCFELLLESKTPRRTPLSPASCAAMLDPCMFARETVGDNILASLLIASCYKHADASLVAIVVDRLGWLMSMSDHARNRVAEAYEAAIVRHLEATTGEATDTDTGAGMRNGPELLDADEVEAFRRFLPSVQRWDRLVGIASNASNVTEEDMRFVDALLRKRNKPGGKRRRLSSLETSLADKLQHILDCDESYGCGVSKMLRLWQASASAVMAMSTDHT